MSRNEQNISEHKALRKKFGLPDLDSPDTNKSDSYAGNWEAVMTKLVGEHISAGLKYNDSRPSYFSLNPSGNSTGPNDLPEIYGKACFGIDQKALANCTATQDGIQSSDPIAKVHSLDHLTDLYTLKLHQNGAMDKFLQGDNSYQDKEIIPLELLYHNPKEKGLVEPELMKLTHKG